MGKSHQKKPACSGAPDVMGIHNTYTYLPTHPTPPLNTQHTHTHTQSVEHQSSGPDGSSMCRQRWELLGYRRHLLRRWRRWWRSERVWVCVCESVNRATLQRWFTTWMRLWQRCKVTVSFIIKSGVARPAYTGSRFIDRLLSPWPTRISSRPIFYSPALSFTLLDCATVSVNMCLWRFVDVEKVRHWKGFPQAWETMTFMKNVRFRRVRQRLWISLVLCLNV